MTSSRTRRFTFFVLGWVLSGVAAWAMTKPLFNTSRGQLAIRGYDAVSYFTDGKAVLGSTAIEHRWMNAVWRFASAEHRELFVQNPERYAPQFGGYCAYAVSRAYTADGDPLVWRIVDGRLYLNYSTEVQQLWEQDTAGNISKGRSHWPQVLGQ